MESLLITLCCAIAGLEALAASLILWLKKRCHWIITRQDLDPPIDREGLAKFIARGWDRELGWVRKPGTSQIDTALKGGQTSYTINEFGARTNPDFEGRTPFGLVFGDSYAFCRQVDDDKTWPHILSELTGAHFVNYGVGNYGLDQAVMRLERDYDSQPAPVAMMAIVPETICRVACVWKHFSEYGNTFALKPRFVLNDQGTLIRVPNPAQDPDDFFRIKALLPQLIELDQFYETKFMRDMLRFPFVWHLWRSRARNVPLLVAAVMDRLTDSQDRVISNVMARNIDITESMYRDPAANDLLLAITNRYAGFAKKKGSIPIFVMLPQLYDLHRLRKGNHYYRTFMDRASESVTVIDLGPIFVQHAKISDLYIDDQFGGHLSELGNQIVAETIADRCAELLPATDQSIPYGNAV